MQRPDSLQIDTIIARDLLRAQHALALEDPPEEGALVDEIKGVCTKSDSTSRTYIAALGTGLLAKAVDVRASAFSKNAKGTPGAHSGRNLCKEVLAALAPQLQLDLGVTGREPLNNQPFFGEDLMVGIGRKVRSDARPAYDDLEVLLYKLDGLDDLDEARRLLRAFIQIRYNPLGSRTTGHLASSLSTPAKLCALIEGLQQLGAEYGKLAQAAAAGLIDGAFGSERVRVGQIHDSDRHFPGDIGIAADLVCETIERAIEVRDKPVQDFDVFHYVNKCEEGGVSKAGLLAATAGQILFDTDKVTAYAYERGIQLVVFFGWYSLTAALVFWTDADPLEYTDRAYRAIHRRLSELEASSAAIDWWEREGSSDL